MERLRTYLAKLVVVLQRSDCGCCWCQFLRRPEFEFRFVRQDCRIPNWGLMPRLSKSTSSSHLERLFSSVNFFSCSRAIFLLNTDRRVVYIMSGAEACCTCATLLSESKVPYDTESEKPICLDRRLECCGRTICATCQHKNSRFQTYCPFCQISSEPTALPST